MCLASRREHVSYGPVRDRPKSSLPPRLSGLEEALSRVSPVRRLDAESIDLLTQSSLAGIIEKSALDGQKTYHHALETAMRQYIKEHASEFQVEGDDGEPAPIDTVAEPVTAEVVLEEKVVVSKPGRRNREHDANAFQAAFDSVVDGIRSLCGGIFGIGKMGVDVVRDLPLSKEVLFVLLVLGLLASNIWTYTSLKQTKNMVKHDERRAKREARLGSPSTRSASIQREQMTAAVKAYFEGHPQGFEVIEPVGDLDSEIQELMTRLSQIEERVGSARFHLMQNHLARPPTVDPVTTEINAASNMYELD